MENIKHITKLELIRDGNIVGVIEPEFGKKSSDLKITSSSSINTFPTAFFESLNPEINTIFMGYSKLDILRISIRNSNDSKFLTMFEGEFYKKEIKSEKEQDHIILNIQAVHSFFRLSLLELADSHEFKETSFKEFVHILVNLAGIKSKINIGENLGNSPLSGLSKSTNAFRLFKEVCLLKNATVTFNTDNSVNIDERSENMIKMKAKVPINITDKDIISSESIEKI